MTTHQLAGLFDALRTGMASMLKADGANSFTDMAEAFREQPDQPLKEFIKQVRKAFETPTPRTPRPGRAASPVVDVDAIVARIRSVRAGAEPAEAVAAQLNPLSNTHLRPILAAFHVPATTATQRNLERAKALLVVSAELPSQPAPPPPPVPTATDTTLVEQGVRLYEQLEADPNVTIPDVRARMEPIRQYPKAVVDEISRRLEYTPDDTREKTFDRMLSNLERIKISQLKAQSIRN